MHVLILYYSRTGRTQKLAQAILEGVKSVSDITPTIKPAEDVTDADLVEADGIIAGSPVYFGTMAAELKSVYDRMHKFRSKMEDKIGAAFATSNHHTGGKETTMLSIIQAFLICGMIVAGDPIKTGGHYGVACDKEYTEKTESDGFKFGVRIANLVKRMN
jgi:NAD(P)H dehydrogenase (quinone)